MTKERIILTSQGLDTEIENLCLSRDFLQIAVKETPRGSCERAFYKAQLQGVNNRLKELGINRVEKPNAEHIGGRCVK